MTQETPLNATLANAENIGENLTDEILDAELATDETTKPTRKSFKHYRKMLRLMDSIHNDIADKVNGMRQGKLIGFFSEEDKFIPETKHNDFYSLWLEVAAQEKVKQPLP